MNPLEDIKPLALHYSAQGWQKHVEGSVDVICILYPLVVFYDTHGQGGGALHYFVTT